MKFALGWDHRGAERGRAVRDHLEAAGHETVAFGPEGEESWDYPEPSWRVARAVADGGASFGVLLCGSGVGMSIAANKVGGVRAALACDASAAEISRRHNDANVLCIAADRADHAAALAMTDAFIAAPFEGGRHARRVEQIGAIERGDGVARD